MLTQRIDVGAAFETAPTNEDAIAFNARVAAATTAAIMGTQHLACGDIDDATRCFELAAHAGHLDSMHQLAHIWLSRAAASSHQQAIQVLVHLDAPTTHRQVQNVDLEQAAEAGDADAMFRCGIRAEANGDIHAAHHWHKRATAAGHTDAMFHLAKILYADGNRRGALTWFTKSAEDGNSAAAHAVAQHHTAAGDVTEALRWHTVAAELGDKPSMIWVGRYHHAFGDPSTGNTWFLTAKAADFLDAQTFLDASQLAARHAIIARSRPLANRTPEAAKAMWDLAGHYLTIGDNPRGHDWLQRAQDAGSETAAILLANAPEYPDPWTPASLE